MLDNADARERDHVGLQAARNLLVRSRMRTRRVDAPHSMAGAVTRSELRRELKRFPTKQDLKRDLKRFATKRDLRRFATKQDLKRFATKQDLERFATKQDLKRFITKDDARAFLTKKDAAAFATKLDLELWAGALELRLHERSEQMLAAQEERLFTRLSAEIARLVRSVEESMRGAIAAVDEKYADLPGRVRALESR